MPTFSVAALWPLLLLAALPVIWLQRRRAGNSPDRRTAAAALRSLALLAVAVALMRPVMHWPSEQISVVYLIDISRSVSTRFVQDALQWAEELDRRHRPAQSRVLAFADGTRAFDSLAQLGAFAAAQGARGDVIGRDATHLEDALVSALPGFTPGYVRRIVLVTDGNQTQGDVRRALPRLRAAGARVYALPAVAAVEHDAWVERIESPAAVRAWAEAELEAHVFSLADEQARVELTIEGRSPVSRRVGLVAGDNRLVLSVRFPRAGPQPVTLRVSAEADQLPSNDALTHEVMVGPALHTLYVEGGSGGSGHLARALVAQGIRVSAATPPALSTQPDPTAGKDVVILSDVRADAIGVQAVQRLQRFVRDRGGGLIFAAGENTYGADGYAAGPIEQLLPVTFEAKRKRQDLDLVLLLDRSASMRRGKIEVAKSAALAALDRLDPEQRLAVIVFDAQPHDVVTLAPVGDKRDAAERIARITSSGQTNIHAALARAQSALAGSQAHVKHIILLSDGLTSPPPGVKVPKVRYLRADDLLRDLPVSILSGFVPIMDELAGANVTLSTVILGEGPDVELMTALAEWGNGKTYLAKSDEDVPRLFAGETRRVRGEATVEEPFQARVKAWSPALEGVDFALAPALRGYVESKPKRFSDVLLEVKAGVPLLVETHYGLGKTVGFLSDVKNRWAADWLTWRGYGKLWAQVVRDSARRESGAGVSWRVDRNGRSAVIGLTALDRDGRYRSDLVPQVRMQAPGDASSRVTLREVAPAQYRAQVPLSGPSSSPWRFQLLPGPGLPAAEAREAGRRNLYYTFPDEDRIQPPNLALLRTLSEQTGGALAPQEDEIFAPRGDGGVRSVALWPACVAVALLAFLIDVLVRRAPWDWRNLRPRLRPASTPA
jgi:Ca-activated chloride channel family protein